MHWQLKKEIGERKYLNDRPFGYVSLWDVHEIGITICQMKSVC